jgi:hypothetical protein
MGYPVLLTSQAQGDVLRERERQRDEEGWTEAHDDQHTDRSMSLAATCYAMFASVSDEMRGATDLPAEINGRTILFPRDILDRLGPHAAKRCIHPNSLARMIVEIAVEEGLIDSILDDGAEPHAC